MIKGHLSVNELEYVTTSLSNNKGMSDSEYSILKQKHPYAVMRDDNALILSSMKHFGKHDIEFNKFIHSKFGRDEYEIDFFYELTYSEKDYTTPHRDAHFVVQTTLLLLSDSFTGGRLMINDEDINLTSIGQYVSFNGHTGIHSVTPVESGQRKVLVIMFNQKKESII